MMDKAEARALVWSQLREVAKPDSRFHFNFNEYIPDFAGSREATERLRQMEVYQRAKSIFITPDNCLERLRMRVVQDGKVQVVSTYGIFRGMVEIRPEDVPPGLEECGVLLDVMEKTGRHISLAEIQDQYHFDLVVTGASAVNHAGIRFGKGHGYFDLEWAMFYQIGVVDEGTPIVSFVHDCQVVDLDLAPSPYDTLCDYIVTPTREIKIERPQKPTVGVIWEKLEPGMMAAIPPLQELKEMADGECLAT